MWVPDLALLHWFNISKYRDLCQGLFDCNRIFKVAIWLLGMNLILLEMLEERHLLQQISSTVAGKPGVNHILFSYSKSLQLSAMSHRQLTLVQVWWKTEVVCPLWQVVVEGAARSSHQEAIPTAEKISPGGVVSGMRSFLPSACCKDCFEHQLKTNVCHVREFPASFLALYSHDFLFGFRGTHFRAS